MRISQFINKYLYDENCGYYINSSPIGPDKDFITSPEISSVFGELIALYLLNIADEFDSISLIEMGAGNATLFFDILTTVNKLADKNIDLAQKFLTKSDFHIVEISNNLTAIQQERLKNFNVNWHKTYQEFLTKKQQNNKIFFICNELFDCFAIDQFVKTDIGWCQRLVNIKDKKINFKLDNFDINIHNKISNIIGPNDSSKAPISSIYEFSQFAYDFANELFDSIVKYNGIVINIDYGYYDNEFYNSLQAVSNHKKINISDILMLDNKCDISAHVNFKMIDDIARSKNLQSSFITQREFLISLAIKTRMKQIPDSDQNAIKAINRLINKDEMGELFKVHLISKI